MIALGSLQYLLNRLKIHITDITTHIIKEVVTEPKGFLFSGLVVASSRAFDFTGTRMHSTLKAAKSSISVRVGFSFGFFFTSRLRSSYLRLLLE